MNACYRQPYRSPAVPPGVKWILLLNVGSFLLSLAIGPPRFSAVFGLSAPEVFTHLRLYQFVTYLFTHGGVWHLALNMFVLWMFGRDLENLWGTRRFLGYYLLTGVGAGLCSLPFIWGRPSFLVGASGAIFGLLAAYGTIFPERTLTLLLFFILPIRLKAKHLVLLLIGLELLFLLGSGGGEGIAHFAHLGGALIGWICVRRSRRTESPSPGHPPPAPEGPDLRDEVNRVLERLAERGWDGLNETDKQVLRDARDLL